MKVKKTPTESVVEISLQSETVANGSDPNPAKAKALTVLSFFVRIDPGFVEKYTANDFNRRNLIALIGFESFTKLTGR
jgi:hypothetical protein